MLIAAISRCRACASVIPAFVDRSTHTKLCCCCIVLLLQVIQYAALLGPWPTQAPDSGQLGWPQAATHNSAWPPPAAAAPAPVQATVHLQDTDAWVGQRAVSAAGASLASNSSGDIAGPDAMFRLHHGMLHPPGLAAPGSNATRVSVVDSSAGGQSSEPTRGRTVGGPEDPTAQLLLWYFLGLAAVQPVVLWLQAAALAVVLNVLRHLPDQQLHYLLLSFTSTSGESSGSASGELPSTVNGGGGGGSLQDAAANSSEHMHGGRTDNTQEYHVFLPLSYAWRAQWSWLDWARFRLLKHSLDILLVRV